MFGSFQITQRRTYGYRWRPRRRSSRTSSGSSAPSSRRGRRSPSAASPTSVTTGAIPRARRPPSRTSPAAQRYAGSRCDDGFAGRFAAISFQRRLTRTTSTPSASTWSRRSLERPGPPEQPRVVLDPVLNVRGGIRPRLQDEERTERDDRREHDVEACGQRSHALFSSRKRELRTSAALAPGAAPPCGASPRARAEPPGTRPRPRRRRAPRASFRTRIGPATTGHSTL